MTASASLSSWSSGSSFMSSNLPETTHICCQIFIFFPRTTHAVVYCKNRCQLKTARITFLIHILLQVLFAALVAVASAAGPPAPYAPQEAYPDLPPVYNVSILLLSLPTWRCFHSLSLSSWCQVPSCLNILAPHYTSPTTPLGSGHNQ